MPATDRTVAFELFQDHYRACVMMPDFHMMHPADHLGFIVNGEQGVTGGAWDFAQLLRDLAQNPRQGQIQFTKAITEALAALIDVDAQTVTRVGVAITGTMHQNTMYLLDDANTQLGEDEFYRPLQAAIRGVFPRATIFVRNRSQLGALAEYHLTEQHHHHPNLIFITVSHGIGTGILNDGVLLDGANHLAGIAGHLLVDPQGVPCGFCGQRGCLARTASGTAMAKAAVAAMAQQTIPALQNEALNPADPRTWLRDVGGGVVYTNGAKSYQITGRGVMRAARTADDNSTLCNIVRTASEHIATGAVALIRIFNPHVIVLGGIAPANHLMLQTVQNAVIRAIFPAQQALVDISWFNDRAALIGAGYYAQTR